MTPDSTPTYVQTELLAALELFSGLAWVKMGLRPDPLTGNIVKDLDEARLAIDATAALAGVIENELDESDRRSLQGMVRDLRLNFVQQGKDAR